MMEPMVPYGSVAVDLAGLVWAYKVIPKIAEQPGMGVRVGTRVEVE